MSNLQFDPPQFNEDKFKALAILLHAKDAGGEPWLDAVAISRLLVDAHGLRVHWRTIDAALSDDKKSVHRRKRAGRWEYAIMQPGIVALNASSNDFIYIDPSQAVQRTMQLHALLAKLTGTVRVCDPYLDETTLEHLDACSSTAPIRLLTKSIKDSGPLRRVVAAMRINRQIEIRHTSTPLHDRYVIDAKEMMILGTSLNGFGKKQCFVIRTGQDFRSIVLAAFESCWSSAKPWP